MKMVKSEDCKLIRGCEDVDIFVPDRQRQATNTKMLLFKILVIVGFLLLFGYTASQSFLFKTTTYDMIGDVDLYIYMLKKSYPVIILTVLITLGLCALIMVLFRFFVGFIVWLIICMKISFFVAIAVTCFVLYAKKEKNVEGKVDNALVAGIVASVISAIAIIVVVVLRRYIKMGIELLREAAKAIISMSYLMIMPFISTVALVLVTVLCIFCAAVIESVKLKQPNICLIARWYNFLVYIWFMQFLSGCQHMIVAGAVGKWYFTRDKTNLGNPVLGSAKNLLKNHLGSVAYGSVVILLIYLLRSFCNFLKTIYKRCCCCLYVCCCCCNCCESFFNFLEYLSHSSYIVTSIFGFPFMKAGREAFTLIAKHAVKIWMVHVLVNMVMFFGKLLVAGLAVVAFNLLSSITSASPTLASSFDLKMIILVSLFMYKVIQIFFDTYGIAIDTVSIAFCVDCEKNNGIDNPYFMSEALEAFMENDNDKHDNHKI